MESLQFPSRSQSTSANLMTLPSELHIQISTYLSYPDALALKHSSRHFYSIVFTGVRLKVDWLIDRFEHKLECPMEKCSFSTDESFCNGRVCGIMERRRWHLECRRVKGGCLLVNGQTCRTDLMPTLMIGIMGVLLNLLWNVSQRIWYLDSGLRRHYTTID
ncbi:hypothetical protein PENSOL_c058G05184 [Penicillium solitum]|uniref:F-box domain-containing protein n=1 Tax=Penicillium solitum TaxID=60172 RepID=A0A1V6QM58_9EURO|nr:uncharacterized protein PENSOL_c058G05184 [Penicillium solitum]OQD90310.1 hypothetical protein PENSOL_c058G05184 [Penicillium solitum]